MARPSKFCPELGRRLCDLAALEEHRPRAALARAAGISPRTLAGWLAAARAGREPFASWLPGFLRAERAGWDIRHEARSLREQENAKERWRRFRAARIEWHRARLGDGEYWRRRLDWLLERRHFEAYERTLSALRSGE